jgi:D-beta-D-heptose 7-phosphate kinase/D-beta-D-heptose 1-phosphate adenosyltransferase
MIVATADLPELAGQVAMVSGGFDPLHTGHIEYFRGAAELGVPVLCNVSSDEWVARKHAPLLTQDERVRVIDAIRYISYAHAEHTTTAEVLAQLRPRYFVKGGDWQGRLPDDERAICEEAGIELVFLDTVVDSSTDVLRRYEARVADRGEHGSL